MEKNNICTYYAAVASSENRQAGNDIEPKNLVSPNQKEIIDFCKQFKGARFKPFRSYEEALNFAENPNDVFDKEPEKTSPEAEAEKIPFPSVDTYKLNDFKRLIDKNDLDQVKSLIDSNPSYVIDFNIEGPTIIKQGPRYNAVHLTLFAKTPSILDYLLKTINSLSFIKHCFPNANNDAIIEKRSRLLDLFLNTPDKVLFNTPLHFACRNNDLKIIKILLDYMPIIVTDLKNKKQLTPIELVQDNALKSEIKQIFEKQVFVTVTRSDDDLNVEINKPCLGLKSIDYPRDSFKRSKISAIIGPTTLDNAKALYETLKSPKRCTKEQRAIRLNDPSRGLEKVACDISLEFHVPCKEYWSFLDDLVDISSPNGLDRLEQHLKKNAEEKLLSECLNKLELDEKGDPGKQIEGLAEPEKDAQDDDDDDDDVYYTAPSSPLEGEPNYLGQTIFFEGEKKGKVDTDVLATLNLAIERGVFVVSDLKASRPLLFQWFNSILYDSQ